MNDHQPCSLAERKVEDRRALEAFVTALGPVFPRADQMVRFQAYLWGLLGPMPRKNMEAIAAVARRAFPGQADLAQALQHFVSHSPWDSRRLTSALRRSSAAARQGPDAVWVVHEAAFPKKGRHSVGVHRQYARDFGKKINCQLGVFVAQVGPRGYFPLAARLYLPAPWLRDLTTEGAPVIPREFLVRQTKAEVALALLDEVTEDGDRALRVAASPAFLKDGRFTDGLTRRGLVLTEASEAVAWAHERANWLRAELGLDHFEGRTWHGWHHHVSLVFAAYHFLIRQNTSGERAR